LRRKSTVRAAGRPEIPPDAGAFRDDERYRVLVDSVKDYAIFMLDAAGRVETWNTGAELLKGYQAQEIIGRPIEMFYTAEDRQRHHARHLLSIAMADGRVEEEGWRVRKDGTRFWADVVITALRDDAGATIGFAKVTRDLTQRRNEQDEGQRREEELRRSEERFRLLIECVTDYAIFMLDPQGRVATWNIGAERIKGYRASEIIGQHFSRFRLPEEVRAGRCEEELERAAREGRLQEEGWRLRKDGAKFWANVVLTAMYTPSGELLGFAKITRDLTERRRLEEESLRRARAEEAVRLRDDFVSIASHELRTPLTAVQIELHALRDRLGAVEDDRTVRRIGRAARNADRLGSLIESLLDVSRIAGGKLVLKTERLDLSQVIGQVVDGLGGMAEQARCELSFRTTGAIEGCWDRLRLQQVVMNLVANALKYGAGKPVTVSVSRDADAAVIEVEDRGPGVPEEDLSRIFGRFERAVSIRHYGGLGLGLYVSQEIVVAEGGTIAVRNHTEGGACFTVRLPIRVQGEAGRPADVTL
jgi:PAS domain S-box-containing protein